MHSPLAVRPDCGVLTLRRRILADVDLDRDECVREDEFCAALETAGAFDHGLTKREATVREEGPWLQASRRGESHGFCILAQWGNLNSRASSHSKMF